MTSVLGKEKLWSSTNLYHHLEVLQGLVPNAVSTPYHTLCMYLNLCQTEESTHPWVDAFFFRTSAMVSSNKQMVLSLEQVISQTAIPPKIHPLRSTALSGLINYAAVIADNGPASELILLH